MRFSPESSADRPALSRPGPVIVLRMLTFAAGSEKPYNDKGYYHRRNCRRLNRFLRSRALRRP
ncbi:conserved hypothetical protein [Klebsiella quasipneumoniae subsp. similipneumoniae]|nr:conserved hypothetical protein [Klebsiella quasipneumoniae subsp. similipneumoniae]